MEGDGSKAHNVQAYSRQGDALRVRCYRQAEKSQCFGRCRGWVMEKPETSPLNQRLQQIWANYRGLSLQDRSEIAEQLGPLGRALNIAANVQNFVASNGHGTDASEDSKSEDDDDIIDVEFTEK